MKRKLMIAVCGAFALAIAMPVVISTPADAGQVCPVKKKRRACPTAPRVVTPAPVVQQVVTQAPPPTPTLVVPGPGPAPIIHVYGDPWAMQMANDGCPMVNDALLLQTLPDGQSRYRWRGTDWAYLPPKPHPQARICTRNGRLAWWAPPKPRVLNPAGAPTDQAPAAPAPQQGAVPSGGAVVFAPMQ